jgi:hypothetical protein
MSLKGLYGNIHVQDYRSRDARFGEGVHPGIAGFSGRRCRAGYSLMVVVVEVRPPQVGGNRLNGFPPGRANLVARAAVGADLI